MAIPAGNPKDSMKSTWRQDRENWGFAHRMVNIMDPFYLDPKQPAPVFAKTDKVPVSGNLTSNIWVIAHAAWPILIQWLYCKYMGANMHPIAVFFLYSYAFKINGVHEANIIKRLGQKWGYFDGDKHARDEVPDVGVSKALASIELTTTVRPLFTVFLAYRSSETPHLSWWLPVELFLYSIVLDFWFYVYHRACHEVDFLWKYHRTHHLTKHPNPFLAAYSDSEQEIIEIALVPLATYAVLHYGFQLPMGFYDWWVCHQFLIFTEAFGHSGLRVFAYPPGLSNPILRLIGCELTTEDHDMHHRKGWRKSSNYGKQTRLWDKLFGTCGDRIEGHDNNLDHNTVVEMPLF